jgi:hypothetical protein
MPSMSVARSKKRVALKFQAKKRKIVFWAKFQFYPSTSCFVICTFREGYKGSGK